MDHSAQLASAASYCEGYVFQSGKSRRQKRVGNFEHVESELSQKGLFYVDIDRSIEKLENERLYFEEEQHTPRPTQFEITHGLDAKYHVTSVVPSTETKSLYINCQVGVDLYYEYETVVFKVQVDPEKIFKEAEKTSLEQALSKLKFGKLSIPKRFIVREVSPDGKILLLSGPIPESTLQPEDELWLISECDANDPDTANNPFSKLQIITEKLDRQIRDIHWTKNGIYVSHYEESQILISKLSETGEYETYGFDEISPRSQFSINHNGDIAFVGFSPDALSDVYVGKIDGGKKSLNRITRATEDFAHFDFGTVESIRWKSKDGIEIEGILRKPSDFDPSRKYPLIVYPHGGPRASSTKSLTTSEFYHPVQCLVARGILILQPNYRGSVGRGRDFMNLNQNQLGFGDMLDIESGIDYLIEQGFVDPDRIGSMGGSQGGYLSAYIGMHTDRCKAVSVFAGVSSWYLYYIGSDSRHTVYLNGSPFEEEAKEVYRKSAPISAIDRAKTPMLLHHGSNDQRITVVSAQEMYRALKDKGVHTELFIINGMGHGFLQPRENYAIALHIYRWFCHYLLGDELDLFKDDF